MGIEKINTCLGPPLFCSFRTRTLFNMTVTPFVSPCCCVYTDQDTYNYFFPCGWCTGSVNAHYECWCIPGHVDTYRTLFLCGKKNKGYCLPFCFTFAGEKTYCPCGFYDNDRNCCCLGFYACGPERNGCFPLCNNCGPNKTCYITGAYVEDVGPQDIDIMVAQMCCPCCAEHWICCGCCGELETCRYCVPFFFQRKAPVEQTMK